jgi:hypothetical protein
VLVMIFSPPDLDMRMMSRWISVAVTPDGTGVFPPSEQAGAVDKSQALIGPETIVLGRSGQIESLVDVPTAPGFAQLFHRLFHIVGTVIHQVRVHLSTGCRQVVENLFDKQPAVRRG